MSRRCELSGVGPMIGHNVSHSNIKTKRRFLPALAETALQSEALGQSFRLKVTNATLRTLDFKGGLDVYPAVGARTRCCRPAPADQEAGQGQAGGPGRSLIPSSNDFEEAPGRSWGLFRWRCGRPSR